MFLVLMFLSYMILMRSSNDHWQIAEKEQWRLVGILRSYVQFKLEIFYHVHTNINFYKIYNTCSHFDIFQCWD
jgi:hypothetical protein